MPSIADPVALARAARDRRPDSPDLLHLWSRKVARCTVARSPVCRGHAPPFDWLQSLWSDRPSLALVLGPRGGGKSFLSALDTHLWSRFHAGLGTRILGGSLAQSAQIHEALTALALDGRDGDTLKALLKTEALYRNGSTVKILAASARSVRGPHVPHLKLDEVDEIDPDIRESSLGMAMDLRGAKASVLMTSTWHRVGGPMTDLMARGEAGEFPVFRFCIFDVLERCPESRSGPPVGGPDLYRDCPACPLRPHCHSEVVGGLPKAKRSDGHYGIDALVLKVRANSPRVFASDYLCSGPRAEGLWFTGWDATLNVSDRIEFNPSLPVHLAIDTGVFTAAVWFQVGKRDGRDEVRVLDELLIERTTDDSAGMEQVGRQLRATAERSFGWRLDVVSTDPAGDARSAAGPRVVAQLERGLRPTRRVERWPSYPGSVADGLALVESLVLSADGHRSLVVHPRCRNLVNAFGNYRRAKRGGQWMDYPEDPLHPHEDLMDALRGGLTVAFPKFREVRGTVAVPAHSYA